MVTRGVVILCICISVAVSVLVSGLISWDREDPEYWNQQGCSSVQYKNGKVHDAVALPSELCVRTSNQ